MSKVCLLLRPETSLSFDAMLKEEFFYEKPLHMCRYVQKRAKQTADLPSFEVK